MRSKIFKNHFLLEFHDEDLDEKFSAYADKIILKYNFWFSLYGLLLSLADTIYESLIYVQYKKFPNPELSKIEITRISSYIVTSIYIIQCVLGCFIKNKLFQKIIVALNYIMILFPFFNIREILVRQKLLSHNIFAMIRTIELMDRVTLNLLLFVHIPDSYLINIFLLLISSIYTPFISGPEGISTYVTMIFILLVISYFCTKQAKTNFYKNSIIQEQNDWYSNLLEHLNSGFLAIRKKSIKYINKNLIDLLEQVKNNENNEENFKEPKKKNNFIYKDDFKVNIPDQELKEFSKDNMKTTVFSNNQININNFNSQSSDLDEKLTKEILITLLKGIRYDDNKNDKLNYITPVESFDRTNLNSKFDLNKFLRQIRNYYKDKNIYQKFLFLGYKNFILKKKEKEQLINVNFDDNESKQIFYYEVYFRFHMKKSITKNNKKITSSDLYEDDEFELIFNNITTVKRNEQKNAEIKCKSTFLSKIAHEFKNPLIGISQLVELISDENQEGREEQERNSVQFTDKKPFSDNYNKIPKLHYLKQIKAISDFLLLLIKDLNYFSLNSFGLPQILEKNLINLDEILNFCRDVGEVLLVKYNKKEVELTFYKNFSENLIFYADSTKLKQILINLISNSVKYTNKGKIEVLVSKISKSEFPPNEKEEDLNYYTLRFEIRDTGIGISPERLKIFLEPTDLNIQEDLNLTESGLGLIIVKDMLNQFNSKLIGESKIGEGSIFSFNLKVEKAKPNLNKESSPSINLKNRKLSNLKSVNSLFDDSEDSRSTKKLNLDQINLNIEGMDISHIQNGINLYSPDIKINNNYNVKLHNPNFLTRPETDYYNEEFSELELLDINNNLLIIVDDETLTRKSTFRTIEKAVRNMTHSLDDNINNSNLFAGLKIFEKEDGIECLYFVYKLLKKGFRKITIISDENMVHMNGSTCAEAIKKLKNLNAEKLPFILVTAYHMVSCPFVDYFVTKPLDETEAKKILSSYINK
jgi:signal transduction histidine kinase/CheY-like chemotaxis protein